MNISIQKGGKTYKTGIKALENILIDITSQTIIGLVGPNGGRKEHCDEATG